MSVPGGRSTAGRDEQVSGAPPRRIDEIGGRRMGSERRRHAFSGKYRTALIVSGLWASAATAYEVYFAPQGPIPGIKGGTFIPLWLGVVVAIALAEMCAKQRWETHDYVFERREWPRTWWFAFVCHAFMLSVCVVCLLWSWLRVLISVLSSPTTRDRGRLIRFGLGRRIDWHAVAGRKAEPW